MRLKSFRAATVAEAMQLVRDHFGDAAVIVSTQRSGDQDGVRVTAAVEEPEVDIAPAPGLNYGDAGEDVQGANDGIDAIDVIAQSMDYHGVPSALADRLLGVASNLLLDDPAAALAVALDAALGFDPLPNGRSERPLMLVGPPGVGKTVTLAKLAVRASFERQPVHVITTDTTRAGGYEQLSGFTRLLKTELHRVDGAEALAQAAGDATLDDLVLIDFVATNPFSEREMEDLAEMARVSGAEPVLVMAAGVDILEAQEIGAAYREIVGCGRMLVTRLDVTRRLGSIVNTAQAARLNLCDYTDSLQVTQGLHKFNPLALARLMLPRAQGGGLEAAQRASGSPNDEQRTQAPAARPVPTRTREREFERPAPRPVAEPRPEPPAPDMEVDPEIDAIIRAAIRDSGG